MNHKVWMLPLDLSVTDPEACDLVLRDGYRQTLPQRGNQFRVLGQRTSQLIGRVLPFCLIDCNPQWQNARSETSVHKNFQCRTVACQK